MLASSRQNWKETVSRAHPIFGCALPPGGAPQKSGGAHQIILQFVSLHFWIASGATAAGTYVSGTGSREACLTMLLTHAVRQLHQHPRCQSIRPTDNQPSGVRRHTSVATATTHGVNLSDGRGCYGNVENWRCRPVRRRRRHFKKTPPARRRPPAARLWCRHLDRVVNLLNDSSE